MSEQIFMAVVKRQRQLVETSELYYSDKVTVTFDYCVRHIWVYACLRNIILSDIL